MVIGTGLYFATKAESKSVNDWVWRIESQNYANHGNL